MQGIKRKIKSHELYAEYERRKRRLLEERPNITPSEYQKAVAKIAWEVGI